MPARIIRQDWGRQPPQSVGLASSSLTAGLFVAASPHHGRELVTGRALTAVSGPTLQVGQRGITGRTNGSSSYWTVDIPSRNLAAFTVMALVRGSGSQALDSRAFTVASSSSDQPLILVNVGTATNTKMRTFWRDTSGNFAATLPDTTADAFTTSAFKMVALRVPVTSGANQGRSTVFIDGVEDVSSSSFTPAGLTVNRVGIGCLSRASASNFYNGDVALGLCWDRALTNEEIAEIAGNPWQIFEPRRIFVPTASAGGPSIAVGPLANSTRLLRSHLIGGITA